MRRTLKRRIGFSFLLVATLTMASCGGLMPPPIVTDATLGKVIIYRNGVAYFERFAAVSDGKLTLLVPAERVDDFLKSLSIVDERTGKAIPVSYPTVTDHGGQIEMTITLPPGEHRLRICYVTESPAWKPTYRVVLGKDGVPAKLHAWAVVDNVSGEDWDQVKIGVGSTSALSFRYDLHSVRLVERATLSTGARLALAPPTGGSPYAASGKKLRVVGNLSQSDVDAVASAKDYKKAPDKPKLVTVTKSKIAVRKPPKPSVWGSPARGGSYYRPRTVPTSPPPELKTPPPLAGGKGDALVRRLNNQLRNSRERLRIEGYAQAGDKEPRQASLARANVLREQLIAQGMPAERVEAVGTGKFNPSQAVRVVAVDEPTSPKPKAPGATGSSQDASQPLGHAHFVARKTMTIEQDHSAMVSILSKETEAEKVYFYDPISARGSKKFAFNAVRIKNPSQYMLDSGPFTVYAGSQFLGEGLSEPILPHDRAFIPYALDRSIVAEPTLSTREEIERLLTIQRGIVTTEMRRIRKTKLTLNNRGSETAKVYVRHQVPPAYELDRAQHQVDKLGGAYLLPVQVPAGEAVELIIEEWTPITKTVDIRSDRGIDAIALYLKKAKLEPDLKRRLDDIVKTHGKMNDLQERITLLGQQMGVYRTRVDEINVQLVTLKKVPQAARLRRHLAKKMEEISERLQKATMRLTDLKGQLMTLKIELQDKLAELTLKRKKKSE